MSTPSPDTTLAQLPETIDFFCNTCSIPLSVPTHSAGISGPCPSCGQTVTAPTPTFSDWKEVAFNPAPFPASPPGPKLDTQSPIPVGVTPSNVPLRTLPIAGQGLVTRDPTALIARRIMIAAAACVAVASPLMYYVKSQSVRSPAFAASTSPVIGMADGRPAGIISESTRAQADVFRSMIENINPGLCTTQDFAQAEAALEKANANTPEEKERLYRLILFKNLAQRPAADPAAPSAAKEREVESTAIPAMVHYFRTLAEKTQPGVFTEADFKDAESAMRAAPTREPGALGRIFAEFLTKKAAPSIGH